MVLWLQACKDLDVYMLGMLLATLVILTIWLSCLLLSYLKHRDIEKLTEAVNNNTRTVAVLLEVTKLRYEKEFVTVAEGIVDGPNTAKISEYRGVQQKRAGHTLDGSGKLP